MRPDGPSPGRRLRRLGRALRHTPDRLLHPVRRRAARASIRRGGRARRVLMVCHGNICRSPYAAASLERHLGRTMAQQLVVSSAGFVGAERPSPPHALAVARSRGVDLSGHRSRVLSPSVVAAADLIFVMDVDQQRAVCRGFGKPRSAVIVLGDLDPQPIDTRTIRDPIEQPVEVFTASYERIDRCLVELVDSMLSSGTTGAEQTDGTR